MLHVLEEIRSWVIVVHGLGLLGLVGLEGCGSVSLKHQFPVHIQCQVRAQIVSQGCHAKNRVSPSSSSINRESTHPHTSSDSSFASSAGLPSSSPSSTSSSSLSPLCNCDDIVFKKCCLPFPLLCLPPRSLRPASALCDLLCVM